jgi:hypothetical protein
MRYFFEFARFEPGSVAVCSSTLARLRTHFPTVAWHRWNMVIIP